jgi:hypothetical protein
VQKSRTDDVGHTDNCFFKASGMRKTMAIMKKAEGVKICGMTVVNCLYISMQFVYRLVSIVSAAPIV